MGKNIQLALPADLCFSNSVRNFVGDLLAIADIADIWINRLVLVMDELFMNAVKYGSKDASVLVYVSFTLNHDFIELSIEDTGTGHKDMDPTKLQEKILSNKDNTSLAKTSGRGLSLIVENWTDVFNISASTHGGIKIIAKKKLQGILKEHPDSQKTAFVDLPEIGVINFSKTLDIHDEGMEKEMVRNLEAMNKKMYIFDLAKVSYINSVNIGLLARLYNIIMKKKAKAVMVSTSNTVKDTLKLVGLSDIIPIVANIDDAKNSLLSS